MHWPWKKGDKVLILVDTSASMGISPTDIIKLKEMWGKGRGGGTYLDSKLTRGYNKVILVSDGFIELPLGVDLWQVMPNKLLQGEK